MTEWFVSSAVLAAILIALRFVLRGKLSPRMQYGLWALLLIRLLIPFSVGQSAVSVENIVPAAEHRVLYLAQHTAQTTAQASPEAQAVPADPSAPESADLASGAADPKKFCPQSGFAARQRYSAGFRAATLHAGTACGGVHGSLLCRSADVRLFFSPLLLVRHACLGCSGLQFI